MLIRFKVSNFLSFKEETEFSMVAGKERIHAHHVVKGEKNQPNLLRAALLYGANAAGKSNFVKALYTLKERVLRSGSSPYSEDNFTSHTSKLLDVGVDMQIFEIEFISNDKIYHYTYWDMFDTVIVEKLSDITNNIPVILIDRRLNSDKEIGFFKTSFLKNKEEKDFLKFIQRSTKPNKLLLTHSIENNAGWFQDAFGWFQNSLQIIFPTTNDANIADRLRKDQDFNSYFASTLQKAGTGITSINIETLAETQKRIEDILNQRVKNTNKISKTDSHLKNQIESLAKINNDKSIKHLAENLNFIRLHHGKRLFSVLEESDGTQRLFDLAFPFYDLATSKTPKVYVVDEFDTRLHTNLSYMLLKSYLEQTGKGQLIATTHDTHLLDLDLLRRDEIWFAEKDEHDATQLYSLYEFNPRYDKKIEKEYLTGRFGAIPFLGNLEFKKQLAKNGKSKK